MGTYLVTDPQSGRKLRLTGDSPPSEQELEQVFASVGPKSESADQALRQIPGVNQLAEIASGANRAIMGTLDVIPKGINEGLGMIGVDARLPTLQGSFGDRVGQTGDFVGQGTQANILNAVGQTAALGAGMGGAIRAGAQALSPLAKAGESAGRGVLRNMGGTTATQDVSMGALSGAGSVVGEEVGGAPGALIGAVAAPAIPALAKAGGSEVLRQIFRGGEAGRRTVADALDDAAKAGTNLSVGQASGRSSVQATENISGKLAGGGPIQAAADRSAENIQSRLASIADDISTKKGAETAGRVITDAIKGRGGFIDRFQGQSGALWNKVDDAIGRETDIAIDKTKSVLDEMVRTDDLGKILNTAKTTEIKGVLDNMQTMDYATLRALRSTIGAKLSSTDLISDIPKSELKRLYGAITEDIKVAAQASGDDAIRAFTRANNYTRSGHSRIDGFIENVMRKADFTKVYDSVTKGGEGAQTINAFKRSMKPEEWEVVASNVVRQMGKSNPGQQGWDGAEYSIPKLLTDWNKLGPAKKAMFSGSRTLDHYGRDLDAIARTAGRIKFGSVAGSNPSGTGQFTANVSTGVTGAVALSTGNAPVFAGVLAAVAANNGYARLMTNPRFVSWLAGTTKAGSKDLGAQLTKLAAIQQSMELEEALTVSELITELEGAEE